MECENYQQKRTMKTNNIFWRWPDACFGAVIPAIPVVIIVTGNVE
jgi:hypothetical protein